MKNDKTKTSAPRFPEWIKRRYKAASANVPKIKAILDELNLTTVCSGAHCPNQGECFSCGTATFMILGKTCTRNCRFCAISPENPGPPRIDEPAAVAEAATRMGLKYVVVTSVTRDDLPDGGAGHFAKTIIAIRKALPAAKIEVLTPDFQGNRDAIETVIQANPTVFNHNVETAPRLYPSVRPQANYEQSLEVLACAKELAQKLNLNIQTKSGMMVGIGETDSEVLEVMADLRAANCDILTIGQYLAPSDAHVPIERFVEPDTFKRWESLAKEMGFTSAACGPFVRSSYHAEDAYNASAK